MAKTLFELELLVLNFVFKYVITAESKYTKLMIYPSISPSGLMSNLISSTILILLLSTVTDLREAGQSGVGTSGYNLL